MMKARARLKSLTLLITLAKTLQIGLINLLRSRFRMIASRKLMRTIILVIFRLQRKSSNHYNSRSTLVTSKRVFLMMKIPKNMQKWWKIIKLMSQTPNSISKIKMLQSNSLHKWSKFNKTWMNKPKNLLNKMTKKWQAAAYQIWTLISRGKDKPKK